METDSLTKSHIQAEHSFKTRGRITTGFRDCATSNSLFKLLIYTINSNRFNLIVIFLKLLKLILELKYKFVRLKHLKIVIKTILNTLQKIPGTTRQNSLTIYTKELNKFIFYYKILLHLQL